MRTASECKEAGHPTTAEGSLLSMQRYVQVALELAAKAVISTGRMTEMV